MKNGLCKHRKIKKELHYFFNNMNVDIYGGYEQVQESY